MNNFFFLFLFLVFGCTNKIDRKIQYYNTAIGDTTFKENLTLYSHIVIIPNEGCSGCISDGTNYLVENIEKLRKTLVLFIYVKDHKLLKSKLPNRFLSNKNVLVLEKESSFEVPELITIYPMILEIKNKKVVSYKVFNSSCYSEIN